MASGNFLTNRLDGLRSRNHQTSSGEPASGYTTPSRYGSNFMPSHSQAASTAERGSLYRRNTNEATTMPNLAPIGQQPGTGNQGNLPNQISGGVEYPVSVSCSLNHICL